MGQTEKKKRKMALAELLHNTGKTLSSNRWSQFFRVQGVSGFAVRGGRHIVGEKILDRENQTDGGGLGGTIF